MNDFKVVFDLVLYVWICLLSLFFRLLFCSSGISRLTVLVCENFSACVFSLLLNLCILFLFTMSADLILVYHVKVMCLCDFFSGVFFSLFV